MKFDHIIMNPPYSGSLHLKILREAIKHSDDIVNLSPVEWMLRPFSKKTWTSLFNNYSVDIGAHLSTLSIITKDDAAKAFDIGIESDLGIYYLTKEGGFDYANYYKEFSKEELKNIDRFGNGDNLAAHIVKYDGTQKHFVPLRKDAIMERWWKYQLINYLDIIENGKVYSGDYVGKTIIEAREANPHENGRNNDRDTFGIAFNSLEEAINFRNCVKSRPYIWIISLFKKSKRFPMERLPYLGDYTHPWTNDMLYKYFGLTDDEVKTIENEVE